MIMGFLAEASTNTVTTALKTGISTIATDASTAIGDVIPVALPIMGAMVIVGVGIKVFKKITGK